LHGIHSPFVFNLQKEVFGSKSNFYAFVELESIRAKLLLTKKKIQIEDLGVGSKVSNKKVKSINHIVKHAVKPPKQAKLLFRIVEHFQPNHILELGTSVGLSTAYLAKAAPKAKIISIEGASELVKVANVNLGKLNIQNVQLIHGNFDYHLDTALKDINKVDLLFLDGNHSKEATIRYFEDCLKYADDKSVFILDDIYWSRGMKEAWQYIKNKEEVSLTIDIYHMGFVFFKKDQHKEHFTFYH